MVISAFRGHCVQLLKSKWSAPLLECAFNDVANAAQRTAINREFYGQEFVIFQDENNFNTLEEVAERAPAKLPGIVKQLEDTLTDVIEKQVHRQLVNSHFAGAI